MKLRYKPHEFTAFDITPPKVLELHRRALAYLSRSNEKIDPENDWGLSEGLPFESKLVSKDVADRYSDTFLERPDGYNKKVWLLVWHERTIASFELHDLGIHTAIVANWLDDAALPFACVWYKLLRRHIDVDELPQWIQTLPPPPLEPEPPSPIATAEPPPADTLTVVEPELSTAVTPKSPVSLGTLHVGRPSGVGYDAAFQSLYISCTHTKRREAFDAFVKPHLGLLDAIQEQAAFEAFSSAMDRRLRKHRRNTNEIN